MKDIANATGEQVYEIYDRKMQNFDETRLKVYKLIMKNEKATKREARRNMLKAYMTFASTSLYSPDKNFYFAERVQEISNEQSALVEKMVPK